RARPAHVAHAGRGSGAPRLRRQAGLDRRDETRVGLASAAAGAENRPVVTAASQPRPAPVPRIRSDEQTRFYRWVALVCVPLVRVFFRPAIRGLEHLPEGGFVLSANQLS